MASRRWRGQRPDEPGAESLGKEWAFIMIATSERVGAGGTGSKGGVGAPPCRCLFGIFCTTSGEGGAKPACLRLAHMHEGNQYSCMCTRRWPDLEAIVCAYAYVHRP